jgi:predicted dehydrogenase
VHHYDIVNWYMGVTAPETVTALGGFKSFEKTNTQWPDTFSGICEYGPGPVARKGFLMHYTFRGGCVHTPTYNESHAKLFCGTEGSLLVNRSGYKLFAEKPQGADAQPWAEKFLTKIVEDVPATDDLLRKHAQHFIDCIRNNKKPYASAETGHYASCPGHLMNIAWRLRRTIEWDGQSEKILNDPDGNFMVTKKYRAPWRLIV